MTNTTLAPDPYDFLALEQLLSDEERMVAHTVRQLVVEKIKPNVGEWF
ncbi:MAG: acyl-CoA dehydrogenase, partial [Hyphomicrobiales bacterium]